MDYSGIVGAVLGSVSTLVASSLLKSVGKMKFYIIENSYEFSGVDNFGDSVPKTGDDIERFDYQYTFDIYNQSETPKIIREICLEVYKDKKIVVSKVPSDEQTKKYHESCYTLDKVSLIIIKPKEALRIKHSVSFKDVECKKIVGCDKIVLKYKVNNNRRVKKLILHNNIIKA